MIYENKTLKSIFYELCYQLGLNDKQCITKKLYPGNPATFIISQEEYDLGVIYFLFCSTPKVDGEGKLELHPDHGWTIYKYETFGARYNKDKDFYFGNISFCKKVKTYSLEEIQAIQADIDPDFTPLPITTVKKKKGRGRPKKKTAKLPIVGGATEEIIKKTATEADPEFLGRLAAIEKIVNNHGLKLDKVIEKLDRVYK